MFGKSFKIVELCLSVCLCCVCYTLDITTDIALQFLKCTRKKSLLPTIQLNGGSSFDKTFSKNKQAHISTHLSLRWAFIKLVLINCIMHKRVEKILNTQCLYLMLSKKKLINYCYYDADLLSPYFLWRVLPLIISNDRKARTEISRKKKYICWS